MSTAAGVPVWKSTRPQPGVRLDETSSDETIRATVTVLYEDGRAAAVLPVLREAVARVEARLRADSARTAR